jgi:cell division protein FtsZ
MQEPAPAPAVQPVAASIQPELIEPDLYEPRKIVAPRSYAAPAPAVEEEPLFPETHDDHRQQRGGWLSLFGGRQRYEAPPAPATREPVRDQRPPAGPVPQARTAASAQLAEEPRGDEGEDLNIPSFLRRLAN